MIGEQAQRRRSGSILVCPLSAVPYLVPHSKASRLVTCLQEEIAVARPEGIAADKHLRLPVHDITMTMPGCIAPSPGHIAALIAFAHAWDGEGTMIVHCWAGISRSTAAAFTAVCALNPRRDEYAIAQDLRRASPTAFPNPRIVRLADHVLARHGRMVAAIEAIGRGTISAEGIPFRLDLE